MKYLLILISIFSLANAEYTEVKFEDIPKKKIIKITLIDEETGDENVYKLDRKVFEQMVIKNNKKDAGGCV